MSARKQYPKVPKKAKPNAAALSNRFVSALGGQFLVRAASIQRPALP